MKMRSLAVLPFLLAIGSVNAQSSQETIPVPAYRSFMNSCLEGVVETQGSDKKSEEQYREDIFAGGLVCQCIYDGISRSPTLTLQQFEQNSSICLAEVEANPEGFILKYAKRAHELSVSPSTP